MHLRYSTQDDEKIINDLLLLCFGDRREMGALNNLEKRYILAFENDKLIAMTGLNLCSLHNRMEIDWTCTHPDYQNRKIMTKLFNVILHDCDFDVFCSCWRIRDNKEANLHKLMLKYGFKKIEEAIEKSNTKDNCNLLCSQKNNNDDCYCVEDLYLRKY